MDGLRREDEACIRTAIAFVALAKHSRLLSESTSTTGNEACLKDQESIPFTSANDNTRNSSRPRSYQQRPVISLPITLPHNPSLPLIPNRTHLLHVLHLAKKQSRTNDSRLLCMHLVQQLSQKDATERLDFFRNELRGIVSIMDHTVSPIRFPLLEHLLSFGGHAMADELLPLIREFLLMDDTDDENDLAIWIFTAELVIPYASSPRLDLWEPVGTGWCHLRSMARTYQQKGLMELWRQHAFARLSELAHSYVYSDELME